MSDANLAESHREFARWHSDGEILERQGILLTRGADRYPGVNFVMRTGAVEVPPDQLVRRATEFFRPRADGFAVRARAHLDADLMDYCASHDWFLAGENAGLLRTAEIAGAVPDVTVRQVQTAREARLFASVAISAFATIGLPRQTAEHIFDTPERMLAPHLLPLLAFWGDQPAAVVLVLFGHGIAGLYWVGTAPWARGRGLARAAVTVAHNRALSMGARAVTLQANREHTGFYERLGYQVMVRYPWYFAGHFPES